MYSGIFAAVLIILGLLLALGVIPFSPAFVGGLFIVVGVAFVAPLLVRTA